MGMTWQKRGIPCWSMTWNITLTSVDPPASQLRPAGGEGHRRDRPVGLLAQQGAVLRACSKSGLEEQRAGMAARYKLQTALQPACGPARIRGPRPPGGLRVRTFAFTHELWIGTQSLLVDWTF